MGWKPKRRAWNWREYLTPEEQRVVKKYDKFRAEIAQLEAENAVLSGQFKLIQNRAVQRARYEGQSA